MFDYFNNAFFTLWKGGIADDVATLRKVFPAYKVLVRKLIIERSDTQITTQVVGHSLGGALAALCAAYLTKEGIVSGNNLQ